MNIATKDIEAIVEDFIKHKKELEKKLEKLENIKEKELTS